MNDFHMVPVATVVLVSFLLLHVTCAVLLVKVFVFWDLSSCSLITFLFSECAGYIFFLFLRTMISLLFGMVLSICTVVSLIRLPYRHD